MLFEQYFGKSDIESITIEDVSRFFSEERQESDKLEFKSYVDVSGSGTKKERDKAKLESIINTICAFLNSDGGILIWGAPEGTKSNDETVKEKVFSGNLTPVLMQLEKDQFISKISDSISPTPIRIRFLKIKADKEKYIYLFEVFKSEFAPHQYKGTYYMRLDGSTRPAPHYYVEALMKRVSYPRLQGNITFGKTRQYPEYFGLPLVVSVHNLSKTIHDKNVRYRIISLGGGLHKLGNTSNTFHFDQDSDITSPIRDIIHYNMPTVDQYYFISKRISGIETLDANFTLMIWGELSPVLVCIYNLHFNYDPQSGRITYKIDRDENSYFFERPSTNSESEHDGLKRADKMALDIFEKRIFDYPRLVAFLQQKK